MKDFLVLIIDIYLFNFSYDEKGWGNFIAVKKEFSWSFNIALRLYLFKIRFKI